jgi:osmotically-inducible protein OsmY
MQASPSRESYGGWGHAGSRQRGPKGYVRSDERLKDEIHERILQSDVDASDVSIDVHDGHVTLHGTISSRFSKYQLEELVDHVIGVRDVDNRVRARRVQGPGGTGGPGGISGSGRSGG